MYYLLRPCCFVCPFGSLFLFPRSGDIVISFVSYLQDVLSISFVDKTFPRLFLRKRHPIPNCLAEASLILVLYFVCINCIGVVILFPGPRVLFRCGVPSFCHTLSFKIDAPLQILGDVLLPYFAFLIYLLLFLYSSSSYLSSVSVSPSCNPCGKTACTLGCFLFSNLSTTSFASIVLLVCRQGFSNKLLIGSHVLLYCVLMLPYFLDVWLFTPFIFIVRRRLIGLAVYCRCFHCSLMFRFCPAVVASICYIQHSSLPHSSMSPFSLYTPLLS